MDNERLIPCTIKIKYEYTTDKHCIFCKKDFKRRSEYIPVHVKGQRKAMCYMCNSCAKEFLESKGFKFKE